MAGIVKTMQGGTVDMRDIKRRLQEDGLDPAATDEEKMCHIWQLYLQTEVSLQGALCSIDEMRSQQANEMSEVENYMEHIRTLSNERETLTLEFEAENEQLKDEIEKLTEELSGYKNSEEIHEMLRQQGLEEIAVGNTSEQIAYLLVERARLMDELEAEQAKLTLDTSEGPMTAAQLWEFVQLLLGDLKKSPMTLDTSEGPMTAAQLWELVQNERQDFEEELAEQRDALRVVKDQMKAAHEDEMASLITENETLQDMVEDAQDKTTKLEKQVMNLSEALANKDDGEPADLNTSVGVDTASLKALQEELEELKEENATLCQNLKTTTMEWKKAKLNLEQEIEEHNQVVESLRADKRKQQTEIGELALTLNELRMERHINNATPVKADNEEEVSNAESDEMEESLKKSLDALKEENRSLSHDLSVTKLELKKEKEKLVELEATGTQPDMQRTHKSRIRSLENKVGDLEGDLAVSQRELWAKQTEYKKFVTQSPIACRRSIEVTSGPLERSRSFSGPRDVTDLQTVKLKAELDRLQSELAQKASLQEELNDKKSQVSELEQSVSKLEDDNNGMAQELQDALAECEKLRCKQQKLAGQGDSNTSSKEAEKEKAAPQEDKATEFLIKEVEELRATVKAATTRAETAEQKFANVEKDLQSTIRQMKPGQDAQKDLKRLHGALEDKDKDITELESQMSLQEEETNNILVQLDKEKLENLKIQKQLDEVSRTLSESENNVREMNARYSDLQESLQDMTSNVDKLKEVSETKDQQRLLEAQGAVALSEQLQAKQAEVDQLQDKLTAMHKKFQSQMEHYTERKERTKTKLQKARDHFSEEKAKLRQQSEQLESELAMVRGVMNREAEWKAQLEDNYRKVLDDKRNLLTKVAENEEVNRDHSRSVSMMQVRVRYLEEENATLQVRIDSLTRQKHNLDKLLKDLQVDRQRELSRGESTLSSLLSKVTMDSGVGTSSHLGSFGSFVDGRFKLLES